MPHARGARPSDDAARVHVGDERRIREPAVGHARVGDVGHVQPVRRARPEPALHEVGPAARALGGTRGHGRASAAHAPDARFAHDPGDLVAADPGPSLRRQPGVHLPVPVHGREEVRADLHDVASRSLVTRGRAACRSFPEPSVAAWRDEPAVQGRGRDPADRPDPETIPILVDARGHQGRVGSGLAAKKPMPSSGCRSPRAVRRPPCAGA